MRDWLFKVIIILAGLIFYLPSLQFGFSQDDFIHLFSSQANSFLDFLNFFNPFYHYPDIFFFRPITTQVYFFLNSSLFGLNPLAFHIEGLILHSVNSVLLFLLIKKLWKNNQIAFISGLFYAVSASHFLSLYYISAFQEIGRMFFILSSILLFFKYQDSSKKIFLFTSLLSFTAALLSKETSLIMPVLLIPLAILRSKNIKNIKSIVLYFLAATTYLVVRISGFQSIFSQGDYQYTFSLWEILQNLKWYLIWSWGLPEVLSTYPSLKLDSLIQFSKDLPFGRILLILSALTILITLILSFKAKFLSKKQVILSLIIFLIPLAPVLILKGHQYPHYLDLAFIGFLPILASVLIVKGYYKYLGYIGIISFLLLQFFSLKLSQQTHWTTHRAKVASLYYKNLKQTYPVMPDNTTIVFTGTSQATKELSYALASKYALLIWYPNQIRNVIYGDNFSVKKDNPVIRYPVSVY